MKKVFLSFTKNYVPSLLLHYRFLVGFYHKHWRTSLEILFLGFRGLFSIFDLLKVSFLFRQALGFVSSLSVLERRRALWFFPDYSFLKRYAARKFPVKGTSLNYVITHWVPGFLTNFRFVAFRHFSLIDFFYPAAFFSFSSNSFWVREAFKIKVPTVSLSSSFTSVGSGALYFIPANLRYYSTLFFFFRVFNGAVLPFPRLKKDFFLNFFKKVPKVFFLKKRVYPLSYLRWSNYHFLNNALFFLRVRSFYAQLPLGRSFKKRQKKKKKKRKQKEKFFSGLRKKKGFGKGVFSETRNLSKNNKKTKGI